MLSASIIIGIFPLVIVRRIFVFGETDALSWRAFSGLGLILSVGCVADYFSLWKTRFLLTKFSSFRSGFAAVAVVIGDFVATFLILLLSWFIFSWFLALRFCLPVVNITGRRFCRAVAMDASAI